MTQSHFLDIKLPLGWLLTFYGVVLSTYGLFTKAAMYEKSAHLNVNLLWGVVMLVIGLLLLLMSCSKHQHNKTHSQ